MKQRAFVLVTLVYITRLSQDPDFEVFFHSFWLAGRRFVHSITAVSRYNNRQAMTSDQEDLALILQEAMEDLREQKQQNIKLLQENKKIAEKLTELLALQSSSPRATTKKKAKVEVSLQTRVRFCCIKLAHLLHYYNTICQNRVHSVYGTLQERNEGWDLSSRFCDIL